MHFPLVRPIAIHESPGRKRDSIKVVWSIMRHFVLKRNINHERTEYNA